ncbi:topoisomerase [Streptomyces sp. CBMA29]|uniref:topoisomerase n=1 Tax=Streptomyces sp. CBMA29 TaxID=1896314 RepID=UPI001CB6C790|nr:topoisomerase [Streptomyces sp. CBMA29]
MKGSAEAAKAYHSQFKGSPAEAYLAARGLGEVSSRFGMGYVGSALTGDERRYGMLVIPYLRPAGAEFVATVRFRCIADECVKDGNGEYLAPTRKENHVGHGKYQSLPGDHPRMYNTAALISPSPYIALSEGEFDTQASELAGVPCVGKQGTSAWRDYFFPALVGFEVVFIIADGDDPGIKAADKMAAEMPNGKVILLGADHDINSFVHAKGADAYRKKLGL